MQLDWLTAEGSRSAAPAIALECTQSPFRSIHFRDMPAEPSESEILAAWVLAEQTDEDRAAIAEWHAECLAVAAKTARARVISETETRNERRA